MMVTAMSTARLCLAAFALAVLLAACGGQEPAEPPADGGAAQVETEAAPDESAAMEEAVRPDHEPLITGPRSEDGLQAILGTGDLGVGVNRVGFVLTSPDGIVTDRVTVTSSYAGAEGGGGVSETAEMVFQPWPYGTRGLHTGELTFGQAGPWKLDISAAAPDGSVSRAELAFEVAEATAAPANGAPAPLSKSKTADDVASLDEITTGSLQDADLYQVSLDEAVRSGMPTVVVFASPAFCTNAVCGPQVEVLTQLKDKYSGRANFVHVDFYDNPAEIQGDLDKGVISPTVIEWGLPSIEWTFVIDREGIVATRFEAFATLEEVEAALLDAL